LAAICVPLLIAIWWWSTRRSRQAPGNAELRESTAASVPPARTAVAVPDAAIAADSQAAPRDWGVPPFEPLSIRTADFEHLPMTAHPDGEEANLELGANPRHPRAEVSVAAAHHPVESMMAYPPAQAPAPARTSVPVTAPVSAPMYAPAPVSARASVPATAPVTAPMYAPVPASATAPVSAPAASDTSATGSNPEGPNVSETQRIVSVRVSAAEDARWSGPELLAALENHGLAFGRYQVFHRRHSDGRTLFCAASLVEPGTFDPARMAQEEFRGLTLFAVLPGPAEPLLTLDALMQTAGALAQTLHGVVQDSTGVLLSQQRAAALREDVARFQSMLTMR
jgi:cell division protein ZipA